MNIHRLKTWPEYFDAIQRGDKTFEIRKNDRGFAVGDVLFLIEWDPDTQCYTGRSMFFGVTYLVKGPSFGLERGYCVMAIQNKDLQLEEIQEIMDTVMGRLLNSPIPTQEYPTQK